MVTCETSFNTASTLQRHLLTHSGQMTHQCGTCEKSFNQASNLQRNLKNHLLTYSIKKSHMWSLWEVFHYSLNLSETYFYSKWGRKDTTVEPVRINSTRLNIWREIFSFIVAKIHKCGTCEKSFRLAQNLKTHIFINSYTSAEPVRNHSTILKLLKTYFSKIML